MIKPEPIVLLAPAIIMDNMSKLMNDYGILAVFSPIVIFLMSEKKNDN
jgi:hypothetical protein